MAPSCVFRVELYRVDTIRLSNVRSHTNLCNSFLLIEINYDAFEFKEKNSIQINLSEVRNTCAFRFYYILGGKQTKFCQIVRAKSHWVRQYPNARTVRSVSRLHFLEWTPNFVWTGRPLVISMLNTFNSHKIHFLQK